MKKFVSLLMVLVLSLTISVAFAASSKTTDDTTSTSTTTAAPAEAAVTPTGLSEAAAATVEAMNEAVANGQSPASVLPQEIQDQLADLGDSVTANEATGLKVDGYKPGCGDVDVEFSFATQYPETAKLKALVTCYDEAGEIMNQFVLPVSPLPNGKVQVHFTEEVLKAMDEAASTGIIVFEAK